MNLLAQILGVLAIITWVISIQQREKKNVLLCQAIANSIYGIQYFLLGAMSASFMNFISFFRSWVFYDDEKKKRNTTGSSFLFFSFIIVVFGILTYRDIFGLIPVFITLAYSYSVWQKNLTITRWIFIIAAFVWIYYNMKVGAYVTVVGNILEIISGIIALIRYKKR